MNQEIKFQVEAERTMRSNLGARCNADRQIEIIIRAVSGGAARAVRQMTETQAGIGRQGPSLTDQVLAGKRASFQIPVLIAGLAAWRRITDIQLVAIRRRAIGRDQER